MAAASPPWETTTPLNSSLIIFSEILANALLVLHPADEPFVAGCGHIHTGVPEQEHHRDHFRDDSDVLPRVERDDHLGNRHLENRGLQLSEPGPVGVLGRLPVLELDDHFDPLLLAHRPDSEERRDIDEPYAADLHVVAGQLMTLADQDIAAPASHLYHVVSHKPVSPLYQIEHAFTLA